MSGGTATTGEGGVDPTPLLSAPKTRPARGGNALGTGTMLLAGIGLMLCICSLAVAFSPNHFGLWSDNPAASIGAGNGDGGVKKGDPILSAIAAQIHSKLVDPDGHTDELEDPAILLDPDGISWGDNKAREEFEHEARQAKNVSSVSDNEAHEEVLPEDSHEEPDHHDDGKTLKLKVAKVAKDCVPTQKHLQHTIRQIEKAQLVMKPFPHLFVPEVFEKDFYERCILKALPTKANTKRAFDQMQNNKDRYQIPFTGKFGVGPRMMNRLGRPDKPMPKRKLQYFDGDFWTKFGQVYSGPEMISTWLKKFNPTLKNRQVSKYTGGYSYNNGTKEGAKTITDNFWYTLSLGRDLKGYNIGPHTDTSDKWVTTLYYLPDSNAHPELGTAVVASKSGRTSSGNVRGSLSSGDFYIARKAKFQKNAVFAFAACTGSWHAVQQVKGTDAIQRDTIQGFVNAPPRGGKKQCG